MYIVHVYPAVERLASLLVVDFKFPVFTRRSRSITLHPEILLICLLVVAVKLLYPFDDEVRHPSMETEPGALLINWDAWNNARANSREKLEQLSHPQSHQDFIKIEEQDVLAMTATETDNYLAWFQRNWVDGQPRIRSADVDFRDAMHRMFPVGGEPGAGALDETSLPGVDNESKETLARLRITQGSLVARTVLLDDQPAGSQRDEVLKPGDRYRYFRKQIDLPERAKPFFKASANLVGLDLNAFLVAVFKIEMKLQRWSDDKRNENTEDDGASNDVNLPMAM